MRQLLLTLLLAGAVAGSVQAQSPSPESPKNSPDTAAVEADWLLLPFASYAPDTKIAAGVVVGYYRPSRPDQSPSNVQLTFTVTQRRQLTAQIDPELYLKNGRWRVQGTLLVSKYPNSFYGIGGDTPAEAEESYTARYGVLDLTAQRRLRPNLRLGPRVFVRGGSIVDPEMGGRIADGRVPGADGGWNAGVGLSGLWDARNNLYYPTTGTYAEGSVLLYSVGWGSEYTFGQLKTDLRAYRSVGPGVLAGQMYTEATAGRAPFPLLPLLGGDERMRGYREGRFRDDVYWTLQAEYRLPLLWRLKGTVFASVGEVGPRIGSDLFRDLETALGVGGRLRLTEDGVHGRLDVAYSPTGIELYISLGEAF